MLSDFLPKAAPFRTQSRVQELKSRLDWGEPALTIIDARNRAAFNIGHIMGSISLPADTTLVDRARVALDCNRDIYIYAETDEETASAAEMLRAAGFTKISEIVGGLAAWKASGYPVESGFIAPIA